MQGYMVVRLQWPEVVVSGFKHKYGHSTGEKVHLDLNHARLNWRRLIKAHKLLRRQFPDSQLGDPYLPDGYFCKYYLNGPHPLAVFEWPARWMKERERKDKISKYLKRKRHIKPRE